MNASSMMIQSSPHRDVLDATPDSDDSKARLVQELKSRGRAAVGAKSWMDAKLLYEKAIQVELKPEDLAILNSNLSLVLKNMGSLEEARQAAEAATKNDATYVKGWWRLGQALQGLHRSPEALEALQKAKDIEPTNKALVKEFEKVAKKVEEEAALVKDEPMPDATATPAPTAPPKTTKEAAKVVDTKPLKPKIEVLSAEKVEEDKGIFSKSDAVRGYKIVNGKKTSYFHNELDEKTKELIGDIAPKKIDPTTCTSAPAGESGGASAWNKAGTWEEKDVSKWAKESLTQQIMSTTFSLPESSPAPGALVTVTKIRTLDGHASFALARGKKRYIYEFLCKLDWKLEGANDLECSGSLAIPDIDGTIDLGEGYELHEFSIDSVSDNQIRPLIDRFVQRGGFHEALNESIDDWVRLFKKEY